MYGKILVPVDGSEASALGLSEAIKIAKCVGGQIRLVHFVNEFVLDYAYGSGVYATDVIELLRKGGRSVLERAKAVVQEQGITPECVLLESMGGRAADLIVAQANEWELTGGADSPGSPWGAMPRRWCARPRCRFSWFEENRNRGRVRSSRRR